MFKKSILLAALGVMAVHSQLTLAGLDVAREFLSDCGKLAASPGSKPVLLNPDLVSSQFEAWLKGLQLRVIGQDEAAEEMAKALEMSLAGLVNPEGPLGSYLFTGPTGVGKSELVKGLIRILGADPNTHLTKINCGELQDLGGVAKLIGGGPGYVGYDDAPLLDPKALEKKRLTLNLPNGKSIQINVILFDEIEKCHPSVFNLLLGVLDDGRINLGNNTPLNLKNSLIIGTSNLGANEVQSIIEAKMESNRGMTGILNPVESDLTGREDSELLGRILQATEDAIRDRWTPEFFNRWQRRIQFLHLRHTEYMQILTKLTAQLQERLFNFGAVKVGIVFGEDVQEKLVNDGTNFKDGARPLQRLLERRMTSQIARFITTNQISDGAVIGAKLDEHGAIEWYLLGKGLTQAELSRLADKLYPGYGLADARFDVEPISMITPSTEPRTAMQIIEENPAVVQKLFNQATVKSIDIEKSEIRYSIKLVRIGQDVVLLERNSVKGTFKGQLKGTVPDNLKKYFPEDKLETFTEEQVRELLKQVESAGG